MKWARRAKYLHNVASKDDWVVRDEFVMDRAATTVTGTLAEPGPGTRTVTGDASIAGGTLVTGTGLVMYAGVPRLAGRMLIGKLATRAARSSVGWQDSGGTRTYAPEGGVTNFLYSPGPYLTPSNASANDIYVLALRPSAGCMVLINKRLWWVSAFSSLATLYPGVKGTTGGDAWAWLRVPDALWLPAPLVSDGFESSFGTTDGLGHAEGVAGGLGSGGGAVAWTQQTGTWGISSGKAICTATSGGIGIATVPAGIISVMVGAGLTRSAGEVGLILRYADANNYVKALHNGTNAQLIKVVAGTPTTLVNAAATYSAGARLVVRADLTKFRLYYNDVLIGTEQTISDASLQTGTAHGLYANNTTDTIDNLVVWACGNEGQYDTIDLWTGSGTEYLVRDEFVTDRAAGAVNGTVAEPGPGTRTATDTGSKLTIASDALRFAGANPGAGDPGLWYGSLARTAGRLVMAAITPADSTTGDAEVGFDSAAAGTSLDAIALANANLIKMRANGATLLIVGRYTAVEHKLALIMRATGMMAFVKGGAFTNWTFLWRSSAGTGAGLPALTTPSSGVAFTVAWLRVPETLWLPTPVASDGFASAFGTTNGLGHAEGVAGGLGSGGNGVAWTQQAGTWGISSGKAICTATSGGIGIATVPGGTIHVNVGAALTRSAGAVGIVVRYLDANNYIYALHNGTNAQLIKVVAGTPTTLIDTAATYSAGARLVVTADATKFRLYYNDLGVGAEQTISDASLQTGTAHGLYTNNTTDTIDDFLVYARGNENQYAALDTWGDA